jgi:predicted component of type VI protein secretion system
MKPLGWRIAVLADLGPAAPRRLVRVPAGGLPEIAAALGLAPEAAKTFEAPLRGLELLAKHAGPAVEVEVAGATSKDLVARFKEAVFEPEMKELREPPLTLAVLDFDLSHQGADLAALEELAGLAMAAQSVLILGASPAFFGLKELKLLAKMGDLAARLNDAAHAGWTRFQKSDGARWTALTVNRWLAGGDPAKPETWLWARGVWLLAAAAARSAATSGHPLDLSGAKAGGFSGLPTRPYPKAANQTVPLATEIEIPDQLAQDLSRAGFTAVSGRTGSDVVAIPVAVNAYRSAPGRLTVTGTLGYQLLAGRLAQACALLMDSLPGTPADAASALRAALLEILGPLAGDAKEAAVTVEPVEAKDPEGKPVSLAQVVVRPGVRLESLEFQYVFQVPLKRG